MIEHSRLELDFRCTTCGYGVARLQPPERCPMCAGNRWHQHPRRHVAPEPQLRRTIRASLASEA